MQIHFTAVMADLSKEFYFVCFSVENADMSGCEIAANDIVKLTHDKLSTEEVSASVVCPSCGAVSLFIGKLAERIVW